MDVFDFANLFKKPNDNKNKGREVDVTYLHERILSVGRPWENRTEAKARRNNVDELSKFLEENHGNKALLLNLSNRASREALDYHRFQYQVLECDLEGIVSLEAVFRLCHACRYWLESDEENVIVAFCNSGVQASRVFLPTFLAFLGLFETTHEAVEFFYKKRLRLDYDALSILTKTQPSLRHIVDKSQAILTSGVAMESQPVVLYMILIDNMPCTDAENLLERNLFSFFGPSEEDIKRSVQPVIRLYECGMNSKRLLYCSSSETESKIHWCAKEGRIVLKCDRELRGDVEIECVFAGNTRKSIFRFVLHTNFLNGNGVYSISSTQIDTPYRSSFEKEFKMDLVVQPPDAASQLPKQGNDHNPLWFSTEVNEKVALDTLTRLHFIQPDPKLCEILCQKGYDDMEAQFALQCTNNSLYEAEGILSGCLVVDIGDEETDPGTLSCSSCSSDEEDDEEGGFKMTKLQSPASPHIYATFQPGLSLDAIPDEEVAKFRNKTTLVSNSLHALSLGQDTDVDEDGGSEDDGDDTDNELDENNHDEEEKDSDALHSLTIQVPDAPMEENQGPLPDDYLRFQRMLKMGVPSGAIAIKMQLEGLDPARLGIKASTSRAEVADSTQQSFRRRKKIHWEAIPRERLRPNSIWAVSQRVAKFKPRRQVEDGQSPVVGLLSPTKVFEDEADPDMQELERLFFMDESDANSKAKNIKSTLDRNKKAVSLVDPKRAQNVGIAFKKLRISSQALCRALNNFDTKSLSQEKLAIILDSKMLPNAEEEKAVIAFRGSEDDLSEAERLFRDIVHLVKDPKIRVEAMMFRCEFESRRDALSAELKALKQACTEVQDSQALQKLFQVVLLIGNKMNSEGDGSIQGFTVASLLKLGQTKSFDQETTVLDFVASFVSKRIPEVFNVSQELPTLETAKRIQLEALRAEMSALHMGHQNVMRAIKLADQEESKDINSDDLRAFARTVQQKLKSVEKMIKETKERYGTLLDFFCEDPTLPSHDFFTTLGSFLQAFAQAAKRQEELVAKEKRRKAQLARKASYRKVRCSSSEFPSPNNLSSGSSSLPSSPDSALSPGSATSLPASPSQSNEVVEVDEMVVQMGKSPRKAPLSETPSLSKYLHSLSNSQTAAGSKSVSPSTNPLA